MIPNDPIRLHPEYQRYDWGTRDTIPRLLSLNPPEGEAPVAELWMGDHPSLPSRLETPIGRCHDLRALVARHPAAILGSQHRQMGDRLPYLFKVLSAARALSVQVHPSKAEAEAGYAAENAAGIPVDATHRNYRDDNHKPELLVALTDFDAMAGFRQPLAVADRLEQLASPTLQNWAARLRQHGLAAVGELYETLLTLTPDQCRELLAPVLPDMPAGEDYQWVKRLHALFGDDPGVLFPLLLNRFHLQPGESIVLAAGVPHAYLQGTGLEVMASSDNVLRGGLTQKHMDVPELLRITDLTPDSVQPQSGSTQGGITRYQVPFDDFQLALLALAPGTRQTVGDSGSAELLLQLSGQSQVAGETLVTGQIVLLPAALGRATVSGDGQLARVFIRQ